MNYYYKSEFELIESFLDAAGDPVDITNIDIEIVYYTSGWERYTVSRIGGVPVNCVFSEAEPAKLTVVFQNHGLGRGILSREITLLIDNVNFASGKQKVMLAPLTSINLVATSGEQGTAEATPIVVVSSSIFENIKYYYKSEFELIEQFFDSEGEAIDITNIDIQIIYLSQWGEYIVSKTSAGNNNCYLDELDSTKLHVVFQNHGLKEGALRKEITLLIDNVNFASGKQKVMLNQESGVELVATGGDQGIGSGSNSIPVIVQSHTMPEKENIVDDDEVTGFDSEDNYKPIRYKKSKIKAFFKTFFDTVYAPIAEYLTSSSELEGLETNAKTITGSINEVRRIVLGATPSWVFDTEADMETWLADPENIAKLQTGNNLLIRDINVPDYWWDGDQAMELEVKIDLTNYYNKTEIGNLLGEKANLLGGNSISGNQNFDSNTLFVDSVNHKVGIGTITPTHKLDVRGTAATDGIRSCMGLDIYPVPNPIAPDLIEMTSGGLVDVGDHYYACTYMTALGETNEGSTIKITVTSPNQTVKIGVPISSDPRVTARRIFRTKSGDAYYNKYLLAVINDNTTSEYIDIIADSALTGSARPVYTRMNTTSNQITLNGVRALFIDFRNTIIGLAAGSNITTGGANFLAGYNAGGALTTGSENVAILGLSRLTTGLRNVGIGASSLGSAVTTNYCVGIGYYALSQCTGTGNVGIGSSVLGGITTAIYVVGLGYMAGAAIADGTTPKQTGNYGVYIGANTKALSNGTENEVVIGYNAVGNGTNTVTLGNNNIADTYLKGRTHVTSSIQINNDTASASAANAGAIRYRADANNSYVEMCMQTGASTYEWIIIKQNTW